MRASYNITNDKLKVWFDDRLPEDDYKSARRCGFTYWHGSQCFAAKWSTQAEDFLFDMGVESVEQDDAPDNVEARVDRFSNYAEKAETSAASSEQYLNERANTERRRENAVNGIERNLELARHWQERIDGAIRHAQYKERPDVIARRIRGLETDRKRMVNAFTPVPGVKPITEDGELAFWCSNGGRSGSWLKVSKLPAIKAWAERWIAHIDRRLEYERACCEAAGGAPEILNPVRKKAVQPKGVQKTRKGETPEFLGAVGFHSSYSLNSPLDWRLVTKVNRNTVEIMSKQTSVDGSGKQQTRFFTRKAEIYSIAAVKTRKEVQAEMPELHEDWERLQAALLRIKEFKAAQTQQAEQVAA
jgi:hypothetical protein